MRIGFFSWGLFTGKGGTERFSAKISGSMLRRGHECVIFHQGGGEGRPVYTLAEGVQTRALALGDAASLHTAKRIVRDMAVDVFCVLEASAVKLHSLAICKNAGIPLLMSERASPHNVENILWNRLERLASFAAADEIHLLSPRYVSSIPDFLQSRVTVIPNPAPQIAPADGKKEPSPRKRILALSRLAEHPKRISLLIQAFALLVKDFPDWDCCICGGGISYALYADMIHRLNLDSRIRLTGSVDNVDAYFSSSHIYCIPSADEGFPNSLLEAQSHGLPSVGFASCNGVNDIIVHGKNGLLVNEMAAADLAASLQALMENPELGRSMSTQAQLLCAARYEEQSVFDQWEALLHKTAAHKNNTRLDAMEQLPDPQVEAMLREICSRSNPLQKSSRPGKSRNNATMQMLRANMTLRQAIEQN